MATRSKTAGSKKPETKPAAKAAETKDDAAEAAAATEADTQAATDNPEIDPEVAEAIRAEVREELRDEITEEVKSELRDEFAAMIAEAKLGDQAQPKPKKTVRKGPFIKRVVKAKQGFRVKRDGVSYFYKTGNVIELTRAEFEGNKRFQIGTFPYDGERSDREELTLEEAREVYEANKED